MIGLIIIIIVLFLLILASYIDIKTKEVPNLISYSIIAVSLGLNLLQSIITKQFSNTFYSFIGFFVFFSLGILLYYTKQWGGGDAKLLMGIGAAFILFPKELYKFFNPNLGNIPFILTILLNIFIIGSVYSILWCIGLLIKNRSTKKILKITFKDILESKITNVWVILVSITLLIAIINKNFGVLLFFTTILVSLTYLLIRIIKVIEKEYLIKQIPTSKLTEGDWLVKNVLLKQKIVYQPSNTGISKEDILKLKKLKIKNVMIKEGIPFVPAITLGVIISIVMGNLILIVA